MSALLLLLVGVAVGLVTGWFVGRSREAATLAEASAQSKAATERAASMQADRDGAREQRDAAVAEVRDLTGQLAAARSDVEAARRASELREVQIKQDQDRVREQFEALAAKALNENSKSWLQMAQQELAKSQQSHQAELDKKSVAVENLVKPINEALGKVDKQVSQMEKERQDAFSRLDEQIKSLSTAQQDLNKETAALVTALRKPQVRGQWGEMQLRRAVEFAGMVEHCDFSEQVTTSDVDSKKRPDMVINLPEGRTIVLDAKVSLSAILEALETDDPAVKADRLQAHAKHIKNHVETLADKAYWEQFNDSPEFVVLFVPGESLLAPALEQDPGLQEYAFSRRVLIATPTILIGLLRTVSYMLQQAQVTENALEVSRIGRELYKRLGTMGGHMDKLGRSLSTSVDTYNKTVGSLERQVLVSARKMKDLGVTDADLSQPRVVETAVRRLASPELLESAAEVRPVRVISEGGMSGAAATDASSETGDAPAADVESATA